MDRTLTSLLSLTDRYRPDSFTAPARFRLNVGRIKRDVLVTGKGCVVERPRGEPDAVICTDPDTWAEMYAGRSSGIEAFIDRRLVVRGSIEVALRFEPLFERPAAGGLRYEMDVVRANGIDWSMISAGSKEAPPLLLLHGLGGTKASWLTVLPQLARRFRVHALDFPGFGASSKPRAVYSAAWFAERTLELMDEMGYDDACIAGNSMGGRVAQEIAMVAGARVRGLACLCPATAFSYRPGIGFIRLLRPELGVAIGRLPRTRLMRDLRMLFADPSRIDDAWFEAAIDDFRNVWRSPMARLAFFSAARNIYLDEPYGENGFWGRLSRMESPALYIFGTRDPLITARFGSKVRKALPRASVKVWSDCGHVPQLEWPDETAEEIATFFAGSNARRPTTRSITRKVTADQRA